MLSEQVSAVLRSSRLALGATQKDAASRAGVSHRLWAEVERGERPNVSMETALRMLAELGVTVRLVGADGAVFDVATTASAAAGRLARAELRRRTWSGRQIRLTDDDDDSTSVPLPATQLEAVSRVSEQAYAIASQAKSAKPSSASVRTGRRRQTRIAG